MRVALLTTNTIHHSYFMSEIIKQDIELHVICEEVKHIKNQNLVKQSFEKQNKIFESKRNKYETDKWFKSNYFEISVFPNTVFVDCVNNQESLQTIDKINPELIIVYGTGLIRGDLLKKYKNKIYNFHGGNPEKYRGLDSHYWSIYHNDYDSLVTTLHKVDSGLDTGNIINQVKIELFPGMELHQLRASATESCILLFISLINNFDIVKGEKQKSKGRYYSLMPEALKLIITKKFENYIINNYSL